MGDRGCRSRRYRGRQGRCKNESGGMGSDRVDDRVAGGDIAAKRPEGLGQRSLDDVDARHHAVLLGNSGAAWPVHADGMHLVQIGHRVIALCKVADRREWSDVAVHRIDALEHDQLRAAGRCAREQLLQVLQIVVAPNLPGTAGGTHSFDHRIMVECIGQDQAVRKQPRDRRDARVVGNIARRENECRFLAMQVGELGLQLYQRPICTRNVARSARARTHRAGGGTHRFDYLRMLAHAEIVVRAPDNDIPRAAWAVPERMRELSRFALQVGEDAITALTFQGINRRLKASVIVEHCWKSFCDATHSAGVWAPLPGSAAAFPSWTSRARPVCTMAATMAPTIGAVRYSQASPKLPVATIGPSARAGLKAAPVRAPPMMMLRVSVIPIASGARLPARPATAVLITTVPRT